MDVDMEKKENDMPVGNVAQDKTQKKTRKRDSKKNENRKSDSEGSAGKSGDVKEVKTLWNSSLFVEGKKFFFDLKENRRGKYLKISEENADNKRSTILLPIKLVSLIMEVIKDAISGKYNPDPSTPRSEFQGRGKKLFEQNFRYGPNKSYFVDLIHSNRGRVLKIAEILPEVLKTDGTNRSVVLLPETLWLQVDRLLDQLNEKIPLGKRDGPVNAVTQTKNAKKNKESKTESKPKTEKNSKAVPSSPKNGKPAPALADSFLIEKIEISGSPKVDDDFKNPLNKVILSSHAMRTGIRKFFFDLEKNDKGRYLKIVQVNNQRENSRNKAFVPSSLFGLMKKYLENVLENRIDAAVEGLETKKTATESESSENQAKQLDARSFRSETGRFFFFDLYENASRRYIRLSEVINQNRSTITFPAESFQGIVQVLDDAMKHE